MNDIIRIDSDRPEHQAPALPTPRHDIRIRAAVLDDFPFIDDLQKKHKKAVGFMWEAAIKGHIAKGNVLVAEATQGIGSRESGIGQGGSEGVGAPGSEPTPYSPLPTASPAVPVGYLIGVDRYLKRDELGIIYQMNIVPEYQRSLVAANLLKAQFDRSAYGCRLYCCWCAQDLAANKFWEAMGFVPLAFRTGGGRGKTKKDGKFRGRMHIFWQKRIRQDDDFPYWFPSQTGAGAIGEDRIVLPIPPGTHWSDAKPVVLPEGPSQSDEALLLEAKVSELEKALKQKGPRGQGVGARDKAKARPVKSVSAGGLHFGPPPPEVLSPAEAEAKKIEAEAKAKQDEAAAIKAELKEAKKKARRAKKKFDPAQEAFARELKDRWLEEVVARPGLLAASAARYDVWRGITAQASDPRMEMIEGERLRLPDAA